MEERQNTTHIPGKTGGATRVALLAWLCLGLALLLRAEIVLDIPMHGAGYGTAFFEESARRFEQLRPGVRVHIHGDPRMAEKLRVRAIGGSFPDATTAELYWPRLIAAGKLIDLAPYLRGPNWECDGTWGGSFLPGTLDTWSREGAVYGLPFAHSCWTIFYNRALFRRLGLEEPRTWEAFFRSCDRLRKAGVAPLALPGMYLRYGDAFLRAAHYDLVGPAGWNSFNNLEAGGRSDPRFARAAGVLAQLADGNLIAGWQGLSHTGAQLAFLEGRAAMVVSGSWFVNEMKSRIPADFELGTMNFPTWGEPASRPGAVQTSSEYFFLFASGDAERDRALVDFFRFLSSRERAEAFARAVDSPVAVKGVPATAFSPLMRPTAVLLDTAVESYSATPNMLVAPGLMQALTDARLQLFGGEISKEQFAAKLESAAGAERERRANPDAVAMRHPLAGGLLLGFFAVLVLVLVWRGWRKRVAPTATTTGQPVLDAGTAAGFVGPATLLYAAFILLPALASLAGAFLNWDGVGAPGWAGFGNFQWLLFESDVFWSALRNNLFLVVVPALTVIPVSLWLAYLLHSGVKGAGFFRGLLLFPNLLGGIAAALLWMGIYEPRGGLAGSALALLGSLPGLGFLADMAHFPWLAPANLYWALIPIYLWMSCGFNLVLYLAAMEGIDQDLYEAASIDGASRARQFFGITLPLIRETVLVSAVFLVIGGLNAFELVWLLTSQDPPTSTHTMGTLLVTTMFKDFQVGRATAVAVLMLALVLGASALILRGGRNEES